jgi:hypothetical protein
MWGIEAGIGIDGIVAIGIGAIGGIGAKLHAIVACMVCLIRFSGAQGAAQVARKVLQTDGVLGLYRGFGMTIVGVIPVRAVGTHSV